MVQAVQAAQAVVEVFVLEQWHMNLQTYRKIQWKLEPHGSLVDSTNLSIKGAQRRTQTTARALVHPLLALHIGRQELAVLIVICSQAQKRLRVYFAVAIVKFCKWVRGGLNISRTGGCGRCTVISEAQFSGWRGKKCQAW